MKKIITLGLLSFGVLILAGCGQQQTSQKIQSPVNSAPEVQQPAQPTSDQKTERQTAPQDAPEDEIANWHTYSNAKLEFEVKYPINYMAKDDLNGVKLINKEEDKKKNAYHEDCDLNFGGNCPPFTESLSVNIKIYNNDSNLSLDNWLKQNKLLHEQGKTCAVNNIKGYCGLDGLVNGADIFFYMNKNNRVVEFSNVGWDENDLSKENLTKNLIVSTFNFTK